MSFCQLPFGPTNPTRIPAVRMKLSLSKSVRPSIWYATFSNSINRLVLRSLAEKSIWLCESVSFVQVRKVPD